MAAPSGAQAGADPAPGAARTVLFFDAERVLQTSARGRALLPELDALRARQDTERSAEEGALAELRRVLEREGRPELAARWDHEADALARLIERQEAELAARQDALLAPLVAELGALVAHHRSAGAVDAEGAHAPLVLLDVGEHPPLTPRPECDVTKALARALDASSAAPGPSGAGPRPVRTPERWVSPAECRARVLLLYDQLQLSGAVEAGRQAVARVETFQRTKQAELDERQRALGATAGGPEHARARLDLADRFLAYAEELAALTTREEERVAEAVRAALRPIAAELPGVVLVEHLEGAPQPAIASCEVTRWLFERLREGGLDRVEVRRGLAASAEVACPAYRRKER